MSSASVAIAGQVNLPDIVETTAAPTLRPYQQRAVNEILACVQRGLNPLYCLPTAGGKGPIIGEVADVIEAQGWEVWIFAHRVELLDQLSGHLSNVGVEHGVISPVTPLTDHPTQICSVDTVRSRIDHLRKRLGRVRLVVIDECFPAGTLIDGRRIETIRPGEFVTSFVEATGVVVHRRVTATMKRLAHVILRIRFDDGRALVCTPNHPLFAECGWVTAGTITQGCGVFVDPLHRVRGANELPQEVAIRPLEENTARFLRATLHQGVGLKEQRGHHGANQSAFCFRADEGAQSNAPGRHAGEDDCDPRSHWSPPHSARRQWSRPDEAAGRSFGSPRTWLDPRICSEDQNGEGQRLALSLQDRHRKSGSDGRSGSGRGEPQRQASGAGRAEGYLSGVVRVASVEVHERGVSEDFERLCPGGLVYNLEVEGTHTYFANGLAVHNCHHSPAGSYQLIKAMCPNAQFLGTTATAFRHDGKPLGNDFNAELRGPSIRDLEATGFISPVKLIAPPTKVDLSRVKRRMGDFVVAQLEAAVNTDQVTQAALLAYAQHAGGLPTLVFCTGVQHAVDAATAFGAAGWSTEVMESTMTRCLDPRPAETKRAARRRCVRGLASGRYQLLFTIGMAGEGVDIPICSAGLDLRPTQSTQLWLQHIGRVKRLYAGKTEAIWMDLVGNWTRHGMPNADRTWSLTGGLKGIERAVAAVRRCGSCHFVTERGPVRCPNCDRKYPIRITRPGMPSENALAVMPGLGDLPAVKIADMPLNALLPLAHTRGQLERIATIKGYHRGWIDHVLRSRGDGAMR